VKKVFFWVLPLFLVACSLLSYQISKDYIQEIRLGARSSNYQEIFNKKISPNRPKVAHNSLQSKTVIVINNGMDSNSFYSFSKNNIPNFPAKGIFGSMLSEPVNDPKQSLYMFLSGTQPNLHGLQNKKQNELLDDMLLVAKENKKNTVLFSNLDFSTNQEAVLQFQKIISDWKKYDFLVFDFNNQIDLISWKKIYLNPILQNVSKSDLFFFCSLIPESNTKPFLRINRFYQSPFLLTGNNLSSTITSPVSIEHQDMTATLSYSMGLSLPSDCLGFPIIHFFTISDKEKILRGYSMLENYVINSVKLLYQYNINEAIIAGYLMESTDSIYLSSEKTLEDLQKDYASVLYELKSYTDETRQKSNLKVSLIFLFLSISFLIVWLLLLVKHYRSFLFGLLFILLFLLLHYFVFRIPVSFPKDSLLSLRWFLFHSSIPLFLSALLVSIFYTIFSGFVSNISLRTILGDLHNIIATFGLFLLCEITYVANFFGFHTYFTSPGYFFVCLLLRNLALIVLLSVTLFLMYGFSYVTFIFVTKYGERHT
jgi:hypothetical protein